MSIKTTALLALAGTLLLGACSQQPTAPVAAAPTPSSPVTSNPAPRAALGLYELHISAAGGKLSSSVTRVGGGKLSAQEISGLTFSAAAAENTSDASGKHYKVAITVNNGSGKDINQPLYVPVAVSGYTQNSTYFRGAKDSSGADSDPSGVTLEQADTATPLIATNVSSSLFALPSGMSVQGVSAQAWQSPTLAAGATQTVTFGFNIPLSNPTYSFNVVFGVFATPNVNHLVMSQVYPGGGANSGTPTYKNDYVELFNPTNGDISLNGLSLQYGSATSTSAFSNIATLPAAATIKPGQYYLVKLGTAGTAGADLTPTPDASGGLNLGASAGKIALVNGTTGITKATDTAVVDFVGYGTANDKEGAATAPNPGNTATALLRAAQGCTDTNVNSSDFTTGTPAPRNSASPINLCQ